MAMVVWVVTDESKSKSCYDAGGIFCGVFSSYEMARDYVDRIGGVLGRDVDISEEIIE